MERSVVIYIYTTGFQLPLCQEDLMEETLLGSPVLGSTELTISIAETMKSNIMGRTQFTPDRYRFIDSRGYCEVYQEISQTLIKYPVTTGISQGMTDGPTLRSKSTGRCNKRPAPFGTWDLPLCQHNNACMDVLLGLQILLRVRSAEPGSRYDFNCLSVMLWYNFSNRPDLQSAVFTKQ